MEGSSTGVTMREIICDVDNLVVGYDKGEGITPIKISRRRSHAPVAGSIDGVPFVGLELMEK